MSSLASNAKTKAQLAPSSAMPRVTDKVEPRGDKIKARREELQMSQMTLAKLVQLSERLIQLIEAGNSTSYRNIVDIAAALNVDEPATLIVGDPPPTISKRKGNRTTMIFWFDVPNEMMHHPDVLELLAGIKRVNHAIHEHKVQAWKQGSILLTIELDLDDAARIIRGLDNGMLLAYRCPALIVPFTSLPAILPLFGLAALVALVSLGLVTPMLLPLATGAIILALRRKLPNTAIKTRREGLELTYSPAPPPPDVPVKKAKWSDHESIFDKLFGQRVHR